MIVVVDFGAGNLKSVQSMFRRVGHSAEISGEPSVISRAEKLILPGVGHFRYGMEQLGNRGLIEVLNRRVVEDAVPVLGICLGAQMLGQGSEEGNVDGFGWLPMYTRHFDRSRLGRRERLPHMGWADTEVDETCRLLQGFEETPRFYFVHSYHFVCDEPDIEVGHSVYGYRFVSAVAKGNVMGVQFHPEKSHKFGMTVLRNFVEAL